MLIAPPKYPISLWNVRSRVLNDLPKANNACEGFNNALRSSITATHPNIWKFLRSMKEEVCLSETKLLQISLGHQINKKKYQMLAKRVKLQVMNTNVLDGSCSDAVRNFALNM